MNYLSLDQFLDLPAKEQYALVFDQGIFLEKRYGENSEFSLYAVNRFFVELEYDKTENLIVGKHAFISGNSLDSYISIDPGSLLQED